MISLSYTVRSWNSVSLAIRSFLGSARHLSVGLPIGKCSPCSTNHSILQNKHPAVTVIPCCGMVDTNGVSLVATPRVCLHDVPTRIKVHGLPPYVPVTMRASLYEEKGRLFLSYAHYIADERGQVDITHDESVGGSYTGVFPSGLLSTLKPGPKEFKFSRLIKRDLSKPWKINVSVHKSHEELETSSTPLASMELERYLLGPGVRRIPIREGRIRGVLFIPAGAGPFPGVIDLFGGIGGLVEFRAAMLASRGVAALALAYFGHDDLPTVWNFDLEYFEEAVELLLSQPEIVPDRCGALGISLGAFMGLVMGTWIEKVKAVVAINGPPGAYNVNLDYRGQRLFHAESLSKDYRMIDDENRISLMPESMYRLYASNPPVVPIERADDETQFFLIAGEDDTWAFQHGVKYLERAMKKNYRNNICSKIYPNTGHILEPPYSPYVEHSYQAYWEDESGNLTADKGVYLKWGGEPKGCCAAQEDSWPRIQTFFVNYVRDHSPWYQQYVHGKSADVKSKL